MKASLKNLQSGQDLDKIRKPCENAWGREKKIKCKHSLTFVRDGSRARIAETHRRRRRGMGDSLEREMADRSVL